VRLYLFGRVFPRFRAATGRGGHRSRGRKGEAKPARDEPRPVDAWTEEEASGAAAGGRTSVRPVVHAQVCEGKADAKLRRAGCNFHFFVHDKFDCRLFFLYALVNGMRMNSFSFELFLHLCWLGNE